MSARVFDSAQTAASPPAVIRRMGPTTGWTKPNTRWTASALPLDRAYRAGSSELVLPGSD